MCKLIIAGSRSITSYATVRTALIESGLWAEYGRAIEVVSGKAPGVDTVGEEIAIKAHARKARRAGSRL